MSKRCISEALNCISRLKNAFRVNKILQSRQLCSLQKTQSKNILYSAVCVERLPVITATKSQTEERFSNLLGKLELENSLKSDHELRLEREAEALKKKQQMDEEEEDFVEGETETALDLQDKWEVEWKGFSPASRETEADKSTNHKSTDRKLDSSLYLLVRQKIEGRNHWVLPQATWEEGETMRDTAERALSSVCGNVDVKFLGNSPCAVAKYDPPTEDNEQGIKLFFFKAWYKEGDVNPNDRFADDYVWVTRTELSHYCHQGYKKSLKKFIFDL